MNAIVCEICGSNNFIKQNGLFVCQNCGTKYTVEEARALLGTVQIDKTQDFDKYMEMGDLCSSGNDFKKGEEYYIKALEIDPTSPFAYYNMIICKCYGMFQASSGSVSIISDITSIYKKSIGVFLDIIKKGFIDYEEHPEFIEDNPDFIKELVIDKYNYQAMKDAEIVKKLICDNFESTNLSRREILSELSPYIECTNSLYEELESQIRHRFGENSPSTKYCREKWKEYLITYQDYFYNLDIKPILNKISNEPITPKKSKKGLFGFFS